SYNTATLTDFTPLLTKIKNAQPSIVLSAAEYAPAILMIKQMVELDLNLKMLWAGTGAVMQKYYEALTKYAEETITCTQWEKGMVFKQDYGPSHDEFIAAYMKEHNETPDYTCATGFQQGLVLQRAMELSKDPLNSDEVRKTAGEMEMTTFYGKFNVDPVTGWQIGHKMGVIQWRNGEKIVTWPMEANPQQLVYPMKKWKER
ncbi:ABC transporter substrate-binding protein, partial [[Eubacterium] cellulosolvens]